MWCDAEPFNVEHPCKLPFLHEGQHESERKDYQGHPTYATWTTDQNGKFVSGTFHMED